MRGRIHFLPDALKRAARTGIRWVRFALMLGQSQDFRIPCLGAQTGRIGKVSAQLSPDLRPGIVPADLELEQGFHSPERSIAQSPGYRQHQN